MEVGSWSAEVEEGGQAGRAKEKEARFLQAVPRAGQRGAGGRRGASQWKWRRLGSLARRARKEAVERGVGWSASVGGEGAKTSVHGVLCSEAFWSGQQVSEKKSLRKLRRPKLGLSERAGGRSSWCGVVRGSAG